MSSQKTTTSSQMRSGGGAGVVSHSGRLLGRIGSPGLTREGQPRLPHHRTCGSAYGGSDQTRAVGPQ